MKYEDVEHKVTTVFGQPLDLHYMNNEVRRQMDGAGTRGADAYLFSLCLPEPLKFVPLVSSAGFQFLDPLFLIPTTVGFLFFTTWEITQPSQPSPFPLLIQCR